MSKRVDALNPRNWTRKPLGTGPFKVAEYTPTEKVRLVRNDRYHLGVAKLEEVVFELSGGSISTRYENNELHVGFVPACRAFLDALEKCPVEVV